MNAKRINRRVRDGGMVLLEVMMALSVFAIVSLGLVTALDKSFDVARDRNAADESARGMRNQLALLHGSPLAPGEKDLGADASGISYHLAVTPEPMLDQKRQPVVGIYRATITAAWKRDGRAETRTISELVYQP
jgi:prepilin-type N-terminal cleavage/methylation domain-containing protein